MKRTKILRIIARLNIGGPAIHTILLTDGLDKSRFESLFVCGLIDKDEGDMSYYAVKKNVKPVFIPELRREVNLFNDITAFVKIYKIIKSVQPDIVHTHTAKAGTLGRFAAILYNSLRPFRKRIILIHTFHGHIFEGYFSIIKTRFFIFVERILAFFTCKIITVSESLKKELIYLKIAKENKIKIVPLGLELDNLLKIPPRVGAALNIGIVGRLVPIKNHRLFLEAATRVISDNHETRLKFIIIGDGELRDELKDYSRKLGISDKVGFLGWQKDPVSVYSQLDVVTLTSMNEGTPVSLIEAMASGRAVVATDVGGVRDLLGKEINVEIKRTANFAVLERGIIVKPGDSLGVAAALNFILENNDLRKNIIDRARSFVSEAFAKERLIRDIENLYSGLLILP